MLASQDVMLEVLAECREYLAKQAKNGKEPELPLILLLALEHLGLNSEGAADRLEAEARASQIV